MRIRETSVEDHARLMRLALKEAEQAYREGEVPIGALLARKGEILASAHNSAISRSDPTAHAEILVIRRAAERLGNYRLVGTALYVTIEPCIMCAGASVHARIGEIVFGALDHDIKSQLAGAYLSRRVGPSANDSQPNTRLSERL